MTRMYVSQKKGTIFPLTIRKYDQRNVDNISVQIVMDNLSSNLSTIFLQKSLNFLFFSKSIIYPNVDVKSDSISKVAL